MLSDTQNRIKMDSSGVVCFWNQPFFFSAKTSNVLAAAAAAEDDDLFMLHIDSRSSV